MIYYCRATEKERRELYKQFLHLIPSGCPFIKTTFIGFNDNAIYGARLWGMKKNLIGACEENITQNPDRYVEVSFRELVSVIKLSLL
jgi:uncharacterized protein (UPF0333 family)